MKNTNVSCSAKIADGKDLINFFDPKENTKEQINKNISDILDGVSNPRLEVKQLKELINIKLKFEELIKNTTNEVQGAVAIAEGCLGSNLQESKTIEYKELAILVKKFLNEPENNAESKYEIIDKLLPLVGFKGKKMPKNFELEALIALTFYPELLLEKIDFLVKKTLLYPYESRPYIRSILNPFAENKYKIVISKDQNPIFKKGGVSEKELFKNLTPQERIGALTHELGHTQKYVEMKNKKEFAQELLDNFSEEGRKSLENTVDKIAIENGADKYLLLYRMKTYLDKVKKGEGNIYFSPDEIEKIVFSENEIDN